MPVIENMGQKDNHRAVKKCFPFGIATMITKPSIQKVYKHKNGCWWAIERPNILVIEWKSFALCYIYLQAAVYPNGMHYFI